MKKIFIKHNGCLNLSYDFNVTKSGLIKAGHTIVENPYEADEIIFAGCGVRAAWVDNAISQMNKFSKEKLNSKVVVSGCISNIEKERIKNSLIANDVEFKSFQEVVSDYTNFSFEFHEKKYSQTEQTDLEGDNPLRRKVTPLKQKALNYLDKIDRTYRLNLSAEYRKTTSGFFFYNEAEPTEMITVSRSCLYNCAFCTIPKGRGKYTSVHLDSIKEKVVQAINKSIFRIILIGDEIGNYGRDLKNGSNFRKLIEEILSIDSRLKIAIRYIEPTPFYKDIEVINKYCLEDRIYLLHIPLQTGSQNLLKEMNRNHSLDKVIPHYKFLIENSNTAFCCNWMVGFPGETEDDFKKTIELATYLQIHLNTVIPFSPRPDTKANERLDKISEEVINDRCNRLENVLLNSKLNKFKELTKCLATEEQKQVLDLISNAEQTNLKHLNG